MQGIDLQRIFRQAVASSLVAVLGGCLFLKPSVSSTPQPPPNTEQESISWAENNASWSDTPPILASAPQGMSLKDLGRPFSANFQRLRGPEGATLFPRAGIPSQTPQNMMKHDLIIVENEQSFSANASAWGIFQANYDQYHQNRYASYRAMFIQDVYEIDDTTSMRQAPESAVYYPARIYMGHIYEVVLSGSEESFHSGIAASLQIASGSIDTFANKYRLKMSAFGRGLVPATGHAIFARSAEEIESNYITREDSAVPILVEWRMLPGRQAPSNQIAWKELPSGCDGEIGCEPCHKWKFYQVQYNAPGRKLNGNAWDGDDSAPDLVVSLQADSGTRTTSKAQDKWSPAWSITPSLEVSAGETLFFSAIDVDLLENDFAGQGTVDIPETIEDGILSFNAGSVILWGTCISESNF